MFDRGPSFHARLLCSAAVVTMAAAGSAAAQERSRINIEPQPLVSALNAFGVQTGQPVISTPELTATKTSPGVRDADDPAIALTQLLAGTGLSYRCSGDTYLIVPGPQSGPALARCVNQGGAGASEGAEGTVEALIVTAQKREEDIQDVPIAISAFTQEALERSQVAGGPDLMTQVPNMTFTKTNFSSYSIQIRGIGTQAISATVDPAVAVAFNNTPFVRNRFFEQEFYDLQRVEVLRGPQGTLYGRNATAGVVNIISAKPKFAYEAKLSADVSNYSSTRLEGMVNLPLVEDKVALRLAGAWTKREGYVTNEITGNPIDGRDLWSTRLSLRLAPTDAIDVNLIWEHFEEDDDRLRSGKQLCHKDIVTEVGGVPLPPFFYYTGTFPGSQATHYQSQLSQGCKPASLYGPESFETPNGYQFGFYQPLSAIGLPIRPGAVDPYVSLVQSRDLRVIESTVDPSYKAKTDTVEFQVNLDLNDTLSLTSETAWSSDFLFSTQDYNRFNTEHGAWKSRDGFEGYPPSSVFGGRPGVLNDGVFCDPQIGCSDRLVAVDLSTAKSRHFSQEFRLASDYEGPFNFSLGANFLRYDTEDKYYVFINALTLFSATRFASNIPTPYVPGVSDNRECMRNGLEMAVSDSFAGVGTAGSCTYIDPNPIGSLNDMGHNYFLSRNPYKLISYAVFGEAYYQIADNLKLTAGLRWTVDKKEAPRIPSWILAPDTIGYPVLEVVEQEWREPTGRLTLDWKPDVGFTDETLLYGSYAHGYKAGGANPPPAAVALNHNVGEGVPTPSDTHPLTFEAEFVDAFEMGAKNTFLDGRVTANLAAFYYDYKGYQLSQIVDRSAITKNFDATVWGLEIEADWRPLENLKLGFKGGYENTKVADGMSAVDVMDRTAGNPDWMVVKPFPIYPSNCIVPTYLSAYASTEGGEPYVHQIGNVAGSGDSSPCETAYFQGLDPITMEHYIPNPPNSNGGWFFSNAGFGTIYPNYPGFNPASAPNNGEGFSKDLSGNELPNAPHFTATLTADYTLPLPSDWLMTLHTDLYYQSEAWTRIFNTEGYDKLKAYTNVNLAAIFTNDAAGWKVMAYVKNVFDRDSITGAFLNSDDSGLTTNVFLTEPRLYGLRVTKDWNGGPWWTGANPNHVGPYPLTVEIGGQIQRQDAPYETVRPSFADEFSAAIDPADAQHRDLDWGDGRDIKLTYAAGPWKLGLGTRFGKTNGSMPWLRKDEFGDKICGVQLVFCQGSYYGYDQFPYNEYSNYLISSIYQKEEHTLVDFTVGRDVGIGGLGQSSVSAGVRYADIESTTHAHIFGVTNFDITTDTTKYPGYSSRDRYDATLDVDREFKGAGPVLSWEVSKALLGNDEVGVLGLDWALNGGVLFGKRKTSITGDEVAEHFYSSTKYPGTVHPITPVSTTTTPVAIQRSESATVPTFGASLGLSYNVGRVGVGAGYRWERYQDAIDGGGYDKAKAEDRTIDGPYFKLSVGFGG